MALFPLPDIRSAKYDELGNITAVIEGAEISIPADPNNRHYQILMRWEAKGNPIEPWVTPPPSPEDVNAERDRRIARGFSFAGKMFDFDIGAKTNISGAAQLAFMAIVAGAQPGDTRWNGSGQQFVWITQDNSQVPMDAQTVVALGQTAAAHEQSHIVSARILKDMVPTPSDYTDDKYWP